MRLCVLHWRFSSMVRPMFRFAARASRSSALYKAAKLPDHFSALPVGGDRRAYTPACGCACCIGGSLRWSALCFVLPHGPREVRPYIRPPNFPTTFPRSQWAATDAPTRPHAAVRAALAVLFDGPPYVSFCRTGLAKFGLI